MCLVDLESHKPITFLYSQISNDLYDMLILGKTVVGLCRRQTVSNALFTVDNTLLTPYLHVIVKQWATIICNGRDLGFNIPHGQLTCWANCR